jgi:hypothetical protein
MEQNKRGGKRLGAGRKPIGDKKKPITLYVENNKIYPFGGEEQMKGKLYEFISGFGKEVETVHFPDTSAMFQDLTKPNVEIKPVEQPKTNYEVKIEPKPITTVMGSYDAFKAKILATQTIKGVEMVMREVKASLMFPKEKLSLEQIAKDHSKDFFND